MEVGYPDFAVQVHERFPKHCECWQPLCDIGNHILGRSEKGHRWAVLSSAGTAFNAFNGALLLALNALGPEAMIICRSILETAINTVYLAADTARIDNYFAFAKLAKHKIVEKWEGEAALI